MTAQRRCERGDLWFRQAPAASKTLSANEGDLYRLSAASVVGNTAPWIALQPCRPSRPWRLPAFAPLKTLSPPRLRQTQFGVSEKDSAICVLSCYLSISSCGTLRFSGGFMLFECALFILVVVGMACAVIAALSYSVLAAWDLEPHEKLVISNWKSIEERRNPRDTASRVEACLPSTTTLRTELFRSPLFWSSPVASSVGCRRYWRTRTRSGTARRSLHFPTGNNSDAVATTHPR